MGLCKSKPVAEREDGQELNARPRDEVYHGRNISAPIPTGYTRDAAPGRFTFAMAVPTTTTYPIIIEHPTEHVGQAVTTSGATAQAANAVHVGQHNGASSAPGDAGTNAAAATQQRAGSTSSSVEGEAAGQGATGNANAKTDN